MFSLCQDPLYSLLPNGRVSDGSADTTPSFFQEYRCKLEHLYNHFYTATGGRLAKQRQQAASEFYRALLAEVSAPYENGQQSLAALLD